MNSHETTPARDLSRAHWQRSEAAAIYTEIFEHVLSNVSPRITDRIIVDHLAEVKPGPWQALNHLVHLPYMLFSVADLPKSATTLKFEQTVGRRVNEYTYQGNVLRTVDEGLQTMMAFPANLLRFIDRGHRKVYGPPLITNFNSVHKVYESVEFSDLIHQAAFAPNGYWYGQFSDLPVAVDEKYMDINHDLSPNFMKRQDSPLGLELDTTKQLDQIRKNNSVGKSTVEPNQPVLSNLTTSGCPVRLKRAQFTSKPEDLSRLAQLSGLIDRPVEELISERPISGIQLGLEFTTDLIGRALELNQHRRIGRRAVRAV